MTAPKSPEWGLEPHTRAKLEILGRYLQAWTPILSLAGFKNIVYIDGFAGPGRYTGGEDGSPIRALKAVLEHRSRIVAQLTFLFVERDLDRANRLEEIVSALALPTNIRVLIRRGMSFESAYQEFRSSQLPATGVTPTFAFLDPFGWTGIPFRTVADILKAPSGEVLITFMYEEVNRFLSNTEQAGNFDGLFGTTAWRQCLSLSSPRDRTRGIHDVYMNQLKTAAKYVRSFEMRNGRDVTDYFLFFATNNRKGLAKMKEAMWKVDPRGEFKFSDATNPNQLVLFGMEPDPEQLRRAIVAEFQGKIVTRDTIEEFVLAGTPFRETHYKQVLKSMESVGALEVVNAATSRRRGTFPDPELRIKFPR